MKIRQLRVELFHVEKGTDGRKDRQRDVTKLIVTFRNFRTAPETLHTWQPLKSVKWTWLWPYFWQYTTWILQNCNVFSLIIRKAVGCGVYCMFETAQPCPTVHVLHRQNMHGLYSFCFGMSDKTVWGSSYTSPWTTTKTSWYRVFRERHLYTRQWSRNSVFYVTWSFIFFFTKSRHTAIHE